MAEPSSPYGGNMLTFMWLCFGMVSSMRRWWCWWWSENMQVGGTFISFCLVCVPIAEGARLCHSLVCCVIAWSWSQRWNYGNIFRRRRRRRSNIWSIRLCAATSVNNSVIRSIVQHINEYINTNYTSYDMSKQFIMHESSHIHSD